MHSPPNHRNWLDARWFHLSRTRVAQLLGLDGGLGRLSLPVMATLTDRQRALGFLDVVEAAGAENAANAVWTACSKHVPDTAMQPLRFWNGLSDAQQALLIDCNQGNPIFRGSYRSYGFATAPVTACLSSLELLTYIDARLRAPGKSKWQPHAVVRQDALRRAAEAEHTENDAVAPAERFPKLLAVPTARVVLARLVRWLGEVSAATRWDSGIFRSTERDATTSGVTQDGLTFPGLKTCDLVATRASAGDAEAAYLAPFVNTQTQLVSILERGRLESEPVFALAGPFVGRTRQGRKVIRKAYVLSPEVEAALLAELP